MGFVGLWYFFNETQPQLIFGLMPVFTGKGYATEASACITNYAFNTLDFDSLIAATDKPHKESQNVLIRIGFEFVWEKSINNKPTIFYKKSKSVF